MKKFIFIAISLLMICNSYASSNWTYVGTTQGGDTLFIDINSIQKQGDSVTFWSRFNYKERTQMGDLSSKVQRTMNCRTREYIVRYSLFYDDLNNEGQLTSNFKPVESSWNPVIPETVLWSVYKFICK